MKALLTILLIVITSLYVLPVKEMLTEKATVCCTDIEEEKAEKNNKEKVKEFFYTDHLHYPVQKFTRNKYSVIDYAANTYKIFADGPPPDFI
jgi:NAD-dependent SIR2 family protein deacetylase